MSEKPATVISDRSSESSADRSTILGGVNKPSDSSYAQYAQQKYGRIAGHSGGPSERYRQLIYGGYKPIEAVRVFEKFLQYITPYKHLIILAGFGFLAAACLQSARVLAIKYIIDSVLPLGEKPRLIMVCLGLVGIYGLLNLINMLCQYLVMYIGNFVVFDVRKRLFDHMQLLHMGFYEKEMSGKLITRLIYDVTALQQLIQSGLNVLVLSGFSFLVNLTLMMTLSWKLTLWSIWILPVYWGITQYYKKKFYQKSMEVRERRSIMTGSAAEVILGAKVVKSFAQEDAERDRFYEMLSDNMTPEVQLGIYNTNRNVLLDFSTGLALASLYLFGGLSFMSGGGVSLGTFVAFSGFLNMLYNGLMQVANLKITTIQAQTGLERVLAVLEVEPEIVEPDNPIVLNDIQGYAEFREVYFGYEEGTDVLHGLNLKATPGQMVALVGPSGSGKTTVMNLLTRFYDPRKGSVLIDGHDLRSLHLKSFRSQLGIVLQDPFLFSGTIEENIRYGRPEASHEEVLEAAEQANALEFIEQLPEGFNTAVGERGGLLSGGQRQRISIARALLKRPTILILDEATSSLDNESERLVQEAMDRLMKGRTVFVIAHRLSTIQNADKIVVMQKGKVVEEGSHEELLEHEGLYKKLYRSTRMAEHKRERERREKQKQVQDVPVPIEDKQASSIGKVA